MTASISTTVQSALNSNGLSQYTNQAAPVVFALEQREAEIKAGLRSYATNRGLSPIEVDLLFVDCGLDEAHVEEVAPEVPTSNGEVHDEKESIKDSILGAIEDFAQKIRNL